MTDEKLPEAVKKIRDNDLERLRIGNRDETTAIQMWNAGYSLAYADGKRDGRLPCGCVLSLTFEKGYRFFKRCEHGEWAFRQAAGQECTKNTTKLFCDNNSTQEGEDDE